MILMHSRDNEDELMSILREIRDTLNNIDSNILTISIKD